MKRYSINLTHSALFKREWRWDLNYWVRRVFLRSLKGVLNQYKKTWTIAGDVAKAGGRRMLLWDSFYTLVAATRTIGNYRFSRAQKDRVGFLVFFCVKGFKGTCVAQKGARATQCANKRIASKKRTEKPEHKKLLKMRYQVVRDSHDTWPGFFGKGFFLPGWASKRAKIGCGQIHQFMWPKVQAQPFRLHVAQKRCYRKHWPNKIFQRRVYFYLLNKIKNAFWIKF